MGSMDILKTLAEATKCLADTAEKITAALTEVCKPYPLPTYRSPEEETAIAKAIQDALERRKETSPPTKIAGLRRVKFSPSAGQTVFIFSSVTEAERFFHPKPLANMSQYKNEVTVRHIGDIEFEV